MRGYKYSRANRKSYAQCIEKKCHGTGCADSSKSAASEVLSDYDGIDDIIELLEKVSEQKRKSEFYYDLKFASFGHIFCIFSHCLTFHRKLYPVIISLFQPLSIAKTEKTCSVLSETSLSVNIKGVPMVRNLT